jgi:hypothetical protein
VGAIKPLQSVRRQRTSLERDTKLSQSFRLKLRHIRRDHGQWHVAVQWQRETVEPVLSILPAVGIDRGVAVFAALSSGTNVAPVNHGKKATPGAAEGATQSEPQEAWIEQPAQGSDGATTCGHNRRFIHRSSEAPSVAAIILRTIAVVTEQRKSWTCYKRCKARMTVTIYRIYKSIFRLSGPLLMIILAAHCFVAL